MEVSWKAFGIFVQAKSFLMVWVSHEGDGQKLGLWDILTYSKNYNTKNYYTYFKMQETN